MTRVGDVPRRSPRQVRANAPGDVEPTDALEDPSAEMRKKVLLAARECFERFGVARTRVEDVATAAGISRPLLYTYFNGRSALVEAMINDELARLFAQLHERVPEKGFDDTLVELSVASVSLGREDDLLADLFDNSPYTDVASLMEQKGSPAHQMMMDLWSPILECGRAQGRLRDDVEDEDLIEWLMMNHNIFYQRRDVSLERMDEMFRRFVLHSFTRADTPLGECGNHTVSSCM
jgi:AcrR family transcriptional regulator